MREIKFRAWDKKEQRLLKVDCIYFHTKSLTLDLKKCLNLTDRDFKDIEIMQFTGLKDKNGKEICEGDIVKRDWKDEGSMNKGQDLFVCELKNQRWLHRIDLEEWSDIFEEKDEVIGNIYENPELLEEQK